MALLHLGDYTRKRDPDATLPTLRLDPSRLDTVELGIRPIDMEQVMSFTRRQFIGSLAAAAATSQVRAAESTPSPLNDPLGVRGDFPVVTDTVYLDSPYITPSPHQAVLAAQEFVAAKGRVPISLGGMLGESNAVREKFAELIGAQTAEIGLLYATSDGENIVAQALDMGAGDNVVIDDLHYETTYNLYRKLEQERGVELRIVRAKGGAASAEAFAELVDAKTKLVSVSWVSHQNGYHHDLKPLAELAHAHGAYLYADAIQGVGMLELDVRRCGIDFLTAGTYKWLLGGYGVAPFYVRSALLDTVEIDRSGSLHIARHREDFHFDLHRDGRKYGYATLAFGAVFQLRAALDYLLKTGVPNIERHTVALAHSIRSGLLDQGFAVTTPADNRSAIVTFAHGRDVAQVRKDLENANIKVSLKEGGEKIRIGTALFNNTDEVKTFLELTSRWT